MLLPRFLPIVLVVCVGASPIAREFCLTSCTETESVPAPAPAHHSANHCHEAGPASAQPESPDLVSSTVSSASRGCNHADEWQAIAIPASKLGFSAWAVSPAIAGFSAPVETGAAPPSDRETVPAPVPISLRTPLRV